MVTLKVSYTKERKISSNSFIDVTLLLPFFITFRPLFILFIRKQQQVLQTLLNYFLLFNLRQRKFRCLRFFILTTYSPL